MVPTNSFASDQVVTLYKHRKRRTFSQLAVPKQRIVILRNCLEITSSFSGPRIEMKVDQSSKEIVYRVS